MNLAISTALEHFVPNRVSVPPPYAPGSDCGGDAPARAPRHAAGSVCCRPPQGFSALGWGLLFLAVSLGQVRGGYPTAIDDGADLYQPGSPSLGLPTWRVSEPFESLWIQYRVIRHTTSAGKTINLDIAYRQRTPSANFNPIGFGPSWEFGWLGTMQYHAETEGGVPWYTDISTWNLTPPFGGSMAYTSDPNAPEYNTYSRLSHNLVSSCGTSFSITYPDGTIYQYGYRPCVFCSGTCDLPYTNYLNLITDPQGRTLTLNYDNSTGIILLTSLVDYDGRTNYVYYNSTFPTNISTIVDAYGRTNTFQYDGFGRLTNIVNPMGMSAGFSYDAAGVITNMVTPYGTDAFQYTVNTNSGNVVNRSMLVTEPEGRTRLFAYRHQATYLNTNGAVPLIPSSYPTNQIPNTLTLTNTFDITAMDARDSFYWGPLSYAHLSTNFLQTLHLEGVLKMLILYVNVIVQAHRVL
jgi:YD repeat-containing protein